MSVVQTLSSVFLYFLCFLCFYIFFLIFCKFAFCSKFVEMIHMNFHAKSRVCSSKNGWVRSTLYFLVLFYFRNLFGLSIWTSMRNLESVAQKNGWVIALGTKEDTYYIYSSSTVDSLYNVPFGFGGKVRYNKRYLIKNWRYMELP